jgi:hypothetical protein
MWCLQGDEPEDCSEMDGERLSVCSKADGQRIEDGMIGRMSGTCWSQADHEA